MIRSVFILAIFFGHFWAASLAFGEEPAAGAQAAVHKALLFLASDMRTWRQERRCAACHHGPMYVWAANVARQQGYAVDDADVAETTQWLVSSDEARIFPKAAPSGGNKPRLSQATIYLAHALNMLPADEPARKEGWKRIAEHLAAAQDDDGSWTGPAGRPPIFGSAEIVTRLAEIAVAESGPTTTANTADVPRLADSSPLDGPRSRARAWLVRSPSEDSHQALALQLWSEGVRSQTNRTEKNGDGGIFAKRLSELQRADGGWSQSPELPSDAFATGQTLLAFHRYGVEGNDDRVKRAIAFLARTQNANGTWPIKSRIDPATGKPAQNLNPITYAATAWATLGLSSYVRESSRAIATKFPVRAANRRQADARIQLAKDCPIGECPG